MSQNLILIDAVSSAWWKKKKRSKEKKEQERAVGWFFLGPDPPCWLCCGLYLLAAIKG
jgi:hypothetical protein